MDNTENSVVEAPKVYRALTKEEAMSLKGTLIGSFSIGTFERTSKNDIDNAARKVVIDWYNKHDLVPPAAIPVTHNPGEFWVDVGHLICVSEKDYA